MKRLTKRQMGEMLKAVIFDCDGVIAESEISRFRHLKKLAEEKGHFGLDEKKHLKFLIGHTSKGLLQKVFGEKMNWQVMDEIVNKRRQAWEDSPEKFLTEIKGIREVCEKLAKEYTLAVASTAARKTVEATLRHLNLGKYFKLIMTAGEVKNVKPDPEIYRETIKRLGLKSSECIVVEDSETGIAAAKKAGIKVVALRNTFYEEHDYTPDLSGADIVIEEITDWLKIVS